MINTGASICYSSLLHAFAVCNSIIHISTSIFGCTSVLNLILIFWYVAILLLLVVVKPVHGVGSWSCDGKLFQLDIDKSSSQPIIDKAVSYTHLTLPTKRIV